MAAVLNLKAQPLKSGADRTAARRALLNAIAENLGTGFGFYCTSLLIVVVDDGEARPFSAFHRKSRCLAAKYSSIVPWKSRWSRVRLVNTAVWNCIA